MAKKKSNRSVATGTLKKHRKGFGFVILPEDSPYSELGDIFISPGSMHGAMDGDTVEIDLIPEYLWGNSPEGIVTKIVNRNLAEVVGTFEKGKKFGFVVPDDRKIRDDVFIRKKNFGKAKNGDKVVAKIIKYPEGKDSAEGKISEIIARKGEKNADVKAIIRGSGINTVFPKNAAEQASKAQKEGITEDEIKKRRDLRDVFTVTIDGAHSKDFDDAVSVEKLSDGSYKLGVHIADVAHYVKENSALDKEAFERGNSVYVLDQVVPMLPEALSNGICSLNPEQDRLTLTCEMIVDEKGRIKEHEIYESVIRSHKRLVYDDVSDIIESGNRTEENGYLFDMAELAAILRQKREAKGSIDFDIDEAEISLDDKGNVADIKVAERRVANKLIEEFMLAANMTVAEHFFWMSVPFVYRVHERPSIEKMEELRTFLRSLGITLKGDLSQIRPDALSAVLKEISGKSYENVVNTVMLRSMQKATYETECSGHFGLALKYYCHFTSPIRRYPDLMIHRVIKTILKGKLDEKGIKKFIEKCAAAAEHSSATERKAIEIEREAERLKMAEYMLERVGIEYDGIISGVTGFGIYVQLDNCVEGMVRYETMRDDYYDYEPEKYRAIGERTHKTYTLGDRVRIKVDSVYIREREINFIMKDIDK